MSLRITHLTKSFGDKKILNDFSFDFNDIGIYAIVGESGVGKTTLLRLIAGLDKDYSGKIIGGGIGNVSVAFQEYRLFPGLSAIDNLVFAISDRKDEAVYSKCKNMLLSLGFSEADLNLLSDELSGGMKQRVSIARALLYDTPILLLDEPTKELDKANAHTVRALIRDEGGRRLVIVVSHSAEDINELGAKEIHLK